MTDGELDQRLRDSILSEEVDTSRLAAAVRRQIQPQPRHVPGWAVAAAALIATLLAAGFSYRTFLKQQQIPQLCIAAAQDHQREIVKGEPRRWLTDIAAIDSLAEEARRDPFRHYSPGHHRLSSATRAAVFPG